MNIKYVIVDSSDIGNMDFNSLLQKAELSLRYSSDRSKFIVKHVGETPDFLSGYESLNSAQILSVVKTSEWSPVNPEEETI